MRGAWFADFITTAWNGDWAQAQEIIDQRPEHERSELLEIIAEYQRKLRKTHPMEVA